MNARIGLAGFFVVLGSMLGCGGEDAEAPAPEAVTVQIDQQENGDVRVAAPRVQASIRRGLRGVNKFGGHYSDGTQIELNLANGTVCHIDQLGNLGKTGCTGEICVTEEDRATFVAIAEQLDTAGDPDAAVKIGLLANLDLGCRSQPAAPQVSGDAGDGTPVEVGETSGAGLDMEVDLDQQQSASRCAQARNNANNNTNNAVSTSYASSVKWCKAWFVPYPCGYNYSNATVRIGPKTPACMGRCGKGCDWKWAGTKYTQACSAHDKCVADKGSHINLWCDAAFVPTIWDTAFNENCF